MAQFPLPRPVDKYQYKAFALESMTDIISLENHLNSGWEILDSIPNGKKSTIIILQKLL
jgi:hypothetical protein